MQPCAVEVNTADQFRMLIVTKGVQDDLVREREVFASNEDLL